MEADSLAQSLEMSAVPWPLLKLCFSVISTLRWNEVALWNCPKRLVSWFGRNHFGLEMSGPVHTLSPTIMQSFFCQWAAMTLIHDLQIQEKTSQLMSLLSVLACLFWSHCSLWLQYNNLSMFNNHYGFLRLRSDIVRKPRLFLFHFNWLNNWL